MRFNPLHFKFETKFRRFKESVWKKYYSLHRKKKLSDYDKFWMRSFRADLKNKRFKLMGHHLPTNTKIEWVIQKDLTKEKLNKKEHVSALMAKVKEKRVNTREPKKTSKSFDGAGYHTIGGVFERPNTIIPLGERLTSNNPLATKTPRHKNKNYIGIELEFNTLPGSSRAKIADALKAAGLARYVDVTEDGSCGWEVRVLLLEDDFASNLTKICNVLAGMGFKTNEKCGTHVHFDMRNRDVSVVYENLFKTQKFLRKFVTRNRKYNSFCKMNKATTFDKQLSLHDRYYSINAQSYERHETLEVRMHQGTLVASELIPWINFLTKIVSYKKVVDKSINTLKQAKAQFDIDEKLTGHLEERLLAMFVAADKKAAPDIPSRGFAPPDEVPF